MDFDDEQENLHEVAERFCREILHHKRPDGNQCIDIGIALRVLESFPYGYDGASVEIGISQEVREYKHNWALQISDSYLSISAGGTMTSPYGSDSYERFCGTIDSSSTVDISGDLDSSSIVDISGDFDCFEDIFDFLDDENFKLYTTNTSNVT